MKSNIPGTYTLNYNHTDKAGNSAEEVTNNGVVDTTAPVITLIGEQDSLLELFAPFSDPGATWAGLVDGEGALLGEGDVNTEKPGVYELVYSGLMLRVMWRIQSRVRLR